jgi:hypothetical protein
MGTRHICYGTTRAKNRVTLATGAREQTRSGGLRNHALAWLVINHLSHNVGGVKHFEAHSSEHSEKSAISLCGWSASSNPGSLVIVSGQELGPTHASHRSLTAIMITTSNSSMKEERDAQSITRCSTAHHGDFRALPRANRTFSTAGNSIPYASSRTGERRAGGPLQTFAIFRPRRSTSCKYLLRHSGRLRTVTCAASTSRKRIIELPCLVMCPRRRRFPLDSSSGTSPR